MIHFEEVKEIVLNYVKEIAKKENRYYVIRDIFGKISLYVEGNDNFVEIETKLKELIGNAWLGRVKKINQTDVIYNEIIRSHKAAKNTDNIVYRERVLVKRSWNKDTCRHKDSQAKVVAFYSYKGGVGRTTTLALTALQMVRMGKKVVAIDLDLEAPGLSTLLRQEKEPSYPRYGVVDYLVEYENRDKEWDINEYIYTVNSKDLLGLNGGELRVMQAANLLDDNYEEYFNKLSRLDFNMPKHAGEDSPIKKLIEIIDTQYSPDFVFIDSRAGIHDIGGLTLFNYADEVVALFYGNEQNMIGMKFVLPKLVQAELPFYLINSPVPMVDTIAEEETSYYLQHSLEVLDKNNYFDELPDLFDENSPHYPVNITYDVMASNIDTDRKIVQLLNKDSDGNIYKIIAEMLLTENKENAEDNNVEEYFTEELYDRKNILSSITNIIPSETASAENEFDTPDGLKKNFYPLQEYKHLFDHSKFLITGSKGSGKTALFKVLSCPEYFQALAKYLGVPRTTVESTEWMVGLDSKGDFPLKANFRAIGGTANAEYYSIYWKILAVKTLKSAISELIIDYPQYLNEIFACPYSQIIDIIEANKKIDEQLSELLIHMDNELRRINKTIIITYDALDFCIDREYRGALISELINFWAENNVRMKNLKSKIFLRNDIFKNEINNVTDKIKLDNYRTTIEWSYDYLLAMVWKRMAEANEEIHGLFKKALEKKGFSLSESDYVGIIPKPAAEVNKVILQCLIGEKMGRGNKAWTYNWIAYRLGDTNNHIVPRSILKLFSTVAKLESAELEAGNKDSKTILKPKSLESSIKAVSEDRITDMTEEYDEYKDVFEDLKNFCSSFPVEEDILIIALAKCGLKEKNIKTDIKILKEIGILKEYQRKKSDPVRYHIPDIYLKGMGLTRKGYR